MYAAGGGLLDPTLTKSTATNPPNVMAMQFLQDLIWKSKVAPRPGAPDFPLFEAGRVGMISAGRWPVPVVQRGEVLRLRRPVSADARAGPEEHRRRRRQSDLQAQPACRGSLDLPQVPHHQGTPAVHHRPWRQHPRPAFHRLQREGHDAAAQLQDLLRFARTRPRPIPAPPQFNEMETALDAVYSKLLANEMTPTDMLTALDAQLTTRPGAARCNARRRATAAPTGIVRERPVLRTIAGGLSPLSRCDEGDRS